MNEPLHLFKSSSITCVMKLPSENLREDEGKCVVMPLFFARPASQSYFIRPEYHSYFAQPDNHSFVRFFFSLGIEASRSAAVISF